MAEMKVMFVASEASPLVKTGGLGDVAGALPAALARLGAEVSVVLPAYRQVDRSGFSPLNLSGYANAWAGQDWPIEAWHGVMWDCDVYLVGSQPLFNRPGVYVDHYGDYPDNLTRFSFFCRATIKLAQALQLTPDILHVNDWQTALLPAILTTGAIDPNPLSGAAKILTIHNLAYQGIFPPDQYFLTGLPPHFNNMEGMEYWGNISLLKAGIVCADAINTVSPTYAAEIKTAQLGHGMDGILLKRGGDVLGIVNGVDYSIWSPEADAYLPATYSASRLKPKKQNQSALLAKAGLKPVEDQPVMGMVGRLAYQKGIEILVPALDELLAEADIRVVVLGSGEERYKHMLEELAGRYPDKVALISEFSESLAHLVQGGSDMLLMPSLYEPCGLSQLYALRYGTIPVVHATGGLVDTIIDVTKDDQKGTGFMFEEYSADALFGALKNALQVFSNQKAWQKIMRTAMKQDFSWDKSARRYLDMYEHYRKS